MTEDPYVVERAKLAAEREDAEERRRNAERAAAETARLQELAAQDMHAVAIRAWRELQAAGIRPVRFIKDHYSSWSGKSSWRAVSAPGEYWAVSIDGPVLVNQHGMFGHGIWFPSDEGTPTQPVAVLQSEIRPIKIGEVYHRVNADWDSPSRSCSITHDDTGRAIDRYTTLEVAVARDVVRRIEAARTN